MRHTNWQQWFGHCNSTDEIKREYKQQARRHHPDLGGDLRTMQELNAAFDAACRDFVPFERPGKTADYYDWTAGINQKVREAIERIITLPGLEIEVCGFWVWVSGDTRPLRDHLKAAEYKWHSGKQRWFYPGCKSSGRGEMTMEEIRHTYGSERVQTRPRTRLEEEAA